MGSTFIINGWRVMQSRGRRVGSAAVAAAAAIGWLAVLALSARTVGESQVLRLFLEACCVAATLVFVLLPVRGSTLLSLSVSWAQRPGVRLLRVMEAEAGLILSFCAQLPLGALAFRADGVSDMAWLGAAAGAAAFRLIRYRLWLRSLGRVESRGRKAVAPRLTLGAPAAIAAKLLVRTIIADTGSLFIVLLSWLFSAAALSAWTVGWPQGFTSDGMVGPMAVAVIGSIIASSLCLELHGFLGHGIFRHARGHGARELAVQLAAVLLVSLPALLAHLAVAVLWICRGHAPGEAAFMLTAVLACFALIQLLILSAVRFRAWGMLDGCVLLAAAMAACLPLFTGAWLGFLLFAALTGLPSFLMLRQRKGEQKNA